MDICVLNPYFYPYKGGTEKVLLEVYSRLAKKHNVTVITSSIPGRNQSRREELRGINVIRLKARETTLPGLPLPLLSFKELNNEINKCEADLYHMNNRYQYFYNNLKEIKFKGKLCLTIHNSLPKGIDRKTDSFGLAYDLMWGRKIIHDADLITGVSKNAIDVTIPRRDRHKAHVIYNGVDYHNFRPISKKNYTVSKIKDDLNFDGPTLVANGRLVPQKGHIYLLEALSMMDPAIRPNLLIIGKGPLEYQIRRAAKRLEIQRFEIRYGLDDEVLPYYYSACDFSAMPSLYEPASLAILESMSCELPVIASKIGGLPEMVGPCGYYSKPKDPKSILAALTRIMNEPEESKRMAQCARKRIIARHSWDKIARQYETLFLNTIKT